MSPELFRRARRAEVKADHADDRRRLRLEFFRAALAEGLDSLKHRHAEGASGGESVRALAQFIDEIIRALTRLIASDAAEAGLAPAPLVVAALGGYGRGELHPSSDIDLMVVYDGERTPYVHRVTQELLYTLWDLGLQIGHSLRSLDDCVAIARTDFPSLTSMQAARLVAGSRRLFNRFRRVLRESIFRRDFGEFLATTLAERDQRYRKFGASPYIGEPNVKESAGGLRDMHTAMWLSSAKFGARTLRELADKGLITPRERAATDAALTFLWRVRNELHFLAGHKNDVLSRDLQPQIAKAFGGYEDTEQSLGVERFMRDYYLHARTIHRLSRRLIARCQDTLPQRGAAERRQRQQALADGLVFLDGALHLADRDPTALRAEPARLMKVFWHMHRLGCTLSPDLERAIEEAIEAIDERVAAGPRRARRLSRHLSAVGDDRRNPCPRCTSWGSSGATYPSSAPSPVSCSTTSITNSRPTSTRCWPCSTWRRWRPGSRRSRRGPPSSFTRWRSPSCSCSACCYTTSARPRGTDTSPRVSRSHGNSPRASDFPPRRPGLVEFLVAHHLSMSHVAQRRDIDDPRTISNFATIVENPQRLRMLYLLTYADMRAVGPGVLTGWQAKILHELFTRTLAQLTGGRGGGPTRPQLVERLQAHAGDDLPRQAVRAHVAMVSDRYLTTTSVPRMAEHLAMLRRLEEQPVVTELFHHPDLGSSDLVVVARDVPGLFSLIAGTLAAHRVNIISAQIHTRADGVAIDTLQVNDPTGEPLSSTTRWARTLDALRTVIIGERSVETLLEGRRQARGEPATVAGPPKIVVDNQLSDASTVVEVKCPDRVGLLYLITAALAALGLDIASARIATEIDKAVDTFYVTNGQGQKIEEAETIERIHAALREALARPL